MSDEKKPDPIRAAAVSEEKELRCRATGNLCGSDTWMVGGGCRCDNCMKYIIRAAVERERERIKDILARSITTGERDRLIDGGA